MVYKNLQKLKILYLITKDIQSSKKTWKIKKNLASFNMVYNDRIQHFADSLTMNGSNQFVSCLISITLWAMLLPPV